MKAEERKTRILNCAKKLFSKNGYYNTQISDIINDAKIARGTVYQYFKNKEDIFVTLLENYYKEWEKTIKIKSDDFDIKRITGPDFLRYRLKNTLLFFQNDHELCNIMLRMGIGLPGNLDLVPKRLEMNIIKIIIKDLNLGKKNNNLHKEINIELTANLLVGALLRTAYYYFVMKRDEYSESDIDQMTEEMATVFIPGIFISG